MDPDRDFVRNPDVEEMMGDIIFGRGDGPEAGEDPEVGDDYSSQFLNLEDLDDRRDGSGEAPEGEVDGSGAGTIIVTNSGEVY